MRDYKGKWAMKKLKALINASIVKVTSALATQPKVIICLSLYRQKICIV